MDLENKMGLKQKQTLLELCKTLSLSSLLYGSDTNLTIQSESKRWTQFRSPLYTWSVGAFAFTQIAYLLKLVIPTTNALPRWRLNVEIKTKRTLHSCRRLSFNELTNAKYLVLHSSHFALN